jgi:hypothetical protein
MSGMRANGRVDHNESAKGWLMISKNVSREERNTIEAIDLKRLLTDRGDRKSLFQGFWLAGVIDSVKDIFVAISW